MKTKLILLAALLAGFVCAQDNIVTVPVITTNSVVVQAVTVTNAAVLKGFYVDLTGKQIFLVTKESMRPAKVWLVDTNLFDAAAGATGLTGAAISNAAVTLLPTSTPTTAAALPVH